MVDVGLTLPNFVVDPQRVVDIAVAADGGPIAAVFGYDHLFRVAHDSSRRPALECFAVLGAVAASTRTVRVGSLVARASLRPPAVLAANFATLERIAPGRIIAGIGAGDGESRAENEEFGLGPGTLADRVAALERSVAAVGSTSVPVWVGGTVRHVGAIAAAAGTWNRWGGDASAFAHDLAVLRSIAPSVVGTWGGLVVLAETDTAARTKAQRLGAPHDAIVGAPPTVAGLLESFVDVGAAALVLAPVDSSNVDNVALVEAVARHLA